jgi:hypothetical protein
MKSLTLLDCLANYLTHNTSRTCGECTICCRALSVKSLGKPMNCRCEHQRTPLPENNYNGCAIYTDRPEECRAFSCAWLGGYGSESDRPDKSGILIYWDTGHDQYEALSIIEIFPGSLNKRYPNPSAADYYDLLPNTESWRIYIHPYGIPRATGDSIKIAPEYESKVIVGMDHMLGNGLVFINCGVIDERGYLHHVNGLIVAPDVVKDFNDWWINAARRAGR